MSLIGNFTGRIMLAVETKERPLKLSAAMVRAILSGEKTQHREVISCACNSRWISKLLGDWGLSVPPHKYDGTDSDVGWNWQGNSFGPEVGEFVEVWQTEVDDHASGPITFPYGKIGDLIWIRETWGVGTRPCMFNGWVDGLEYRADDFELGDHDLLPLRVIEPPEGIELSDFEGRWRQCHQMPRWASRITLEITDIRIERMLDATEESAKAEGMEHHVFPGITRSGTGDVVEPKNCSVTNLERWEHYCKEMFGIPTWSLNPWMWVIEFKDISK